MTKEELKQQLYSYRDIRRELDQTEDLLCTLESKMYSPKGARFDSVPRGSGSGDPMLDIVNRHIRLEEKCAVLQGKLLEKQLQIEDLIAPLGPRQRVLMRCYYIDCKTWDQIGMDMGYSWSQVHRIHNSALLHLLETGDFTEDGERKP